MTRGPNPTRWLVAMILALSVSAGTCWAADDDGKAPAPGAAPAAPDGAGPAAPTVAAPTPPAPTVEAPTPPPPTVAAPPPTIAAPPPAAAAASGPPDDIKAPADPVEKAAFEVLTKHCQRCHQAGHLTGRQKPAKDFGNILKLEELAVNSRYILPGNPHGSMIIKQIENGNMPYDAVPNGAANSPSPDELKALVTWVERLGTQTAACDQKFITTNDVVKYMTDDIANVPTSRQKGTRYFTLTNWANTCVDRTSKGAMEVYRQGTVKLLNSLSRSAEIVHLETVDPYKAILRFNIDDLGWKASDWDTIVAEYPYPTQPDSPINAVLENATGTKLAYVRADWFVFTASKPKLYNTLLGLPATFQQLAKDQGVDIDGDIKAFRVKRATTSRSGVSAHNRLVERHASRFGYFWTSYDFRGDSGKQNLFDHPLGPGALAIGGDGFEPAGGETVLSLANGFQAYYLNVAKGDAIDKGPTDIVGDPDRVDKQVTNGISCMGCHENDAGFHGIRKVTDEVRDRILGDRAQSREIRDAVREMYPEHAEMDALLAGDSKHFADAEIRAGLDPGLKLNGIEMINAMSKRYEDPVDASMAAAEMGMTKDEFAKAAETASTKERTILRRLAQGTVPREDFEARYKEIAGDITDLKIVVLAAAPGAAPAPAVEKAKTAAVDGLALSSDKSTYKQGDAPVFSIRAQHDCFLTVTDVDASNKGGVIFPNKFQQDNRIKGGTDIQIPGPSAQFQFHLDDKGTETLVAVCTDKNIEVDGIKHDFGHAPITAVNDYNGTVARSIQKTRSISVHPVAAASGAPAPVTGGAPAAGGAPASAVGGAVIRAAIVLQVQ